MIFLSLSRYVTEKQLVDAGPLLALLAGIYGAITPVRQNEPISTGGTQ
jgi:hypothetical protein